MVADAQAVTKKQKRQSNDPTTTRAFRGSWSGYERDDYFLNPDGPYPRFFRSSYVVGLDFDDDGRVAAPVDIDGDGDLDLALQSLQGLRLMENTTPHRNFARLRLRATRTHPDALNARVKITAGGVTQQGYVMKSDGYLAQIPADLHFGLAAATSIDAVHVVWPSGTAQEWKNIPGNQLVHLEEGSDSFKAESLRRWPEDSRPKVAPQFSWDLSGETLAGEMAPLAAKGKPAVINFWGVNCGPCKSELPALAELARNSGDALRILGVSVDNADLGAVRAMVKEFNLPYPQFLANDVILKSFFGDSGQAILPSTFVFDESGRLRRLFRRAVTPVELESLLVSFREEGVSALQLEILANEHWKRQDLPAAIAAVEKAIALRPRPVSYHAYGLYLASVGRDQEAIQAYRNALELDPAYIDVCYNLAVALHATGSAEEALPFYQKAFALKKEDGEFLLLWGSASAEARKFEQAKDLLDRAIVALPSNPRALNAKGKLHMLLGQDAEARRFFESASALDPSFEEPKRWLRELEKRGGK